jgi:hypothetical protein
MTLKELEQIAFNSKDAIWDKANSVGRDVKLYLHWSAGRYGQEFEDYHVNIDADGSIFLSTNDLSDNKSHSYHRNTGSVGIALECCYNATTNDLGEFPPTAAQIESMAQVVAVLCKAFDLTCDIKRVMTHAEAADNKDGLSPHEPYGPDSTCERWDLWFLKNGDAPWSGGDIIRGKAQFYINEGI